LSDVRGAAGAPPRRVAVTGLGAMSALGHDVPSLWGAVQDGVCGIRPIAGLDTQRLIVKHAAEIVGFAPQAHFDARRLPMLDRTSQLALVAAREALRMALHADAPPVGFAGLQAAGFAAQRCGAILGAGIGIETFDNAYQTLYGEGSNRLHPLTVPRIMPNAPASHVSIEFGLRGPCFATASACASASHALGLSFQMIRSGMLDLAVSGGSDASISLGFMKAWDALRVLSPDGCRPFSRDRSGLVIGEGAAILVLEEWQHAQARGATIHAEMLGFGMSADAGDITAPDAAGASQAMMAALADAGLAPEAIDYVNAHGTGTRLNDRTETAALAQVFGAHLARLPVSSSKSMLGHCLNAGGALEALVTVLALRDGVIPPTIGFREPDPECALDCVPNQARTATLRAALSNSFAFGGLNAVLAFGSAA
jgi:nodulation protein E